MYLFQKCFCSFLPFKLPYMLLKQFSINVKFGFMRLCSQKKKKSVAYKRLVCIFLT